MNYRLGFDLGYTSIGWSVILLDDDLNPARIENFGVRIFPSGRDAKTKEPISVNRRTKRGASRNHDRYIMRRKALLKFMLDNHLQPLQKSQRKQLAQTNPYEIRNKAVSEKLSLHEIGRALFHINQRRGFKSNLIADGKTDDKEQKGLKKGIDDLSKILNEKKLTIGQYLYKRQLEKKTTRMKAQNKSYEIYTNRNMYIQEVDQILSFQQKFHTESLTDTVIKRIKEIIFFQRPLKLQEAGCCSLLEGEKRARASYTENQLFRIYQEVNNLDFVKESSEVNSLTDSQRKTILKYLVSDFSELRKDRMLSWTKIRKLLNISGLNFNLETMGRKGLKADTTILEMQSILGRRWSDLSPERKRKLIDVIITGQTTKKLKKALSNFFKDENLSGETLKEIIASKTSLEPGYGKVSLKAINKILPFLEQGFVYSQACEKAGINHSDQRTGEVFPHANLPYYGQVLQKHVIGGTFNDKTKIEEYYGKINNPTVHMALNQFRIVLNEIVKKHGQPPKQIHIELARETSMSTKQLSEHNSQQTKNRKENERINQILAEHGIKQNYDNRMKYKLWQDLANEPTQRCCPYTGKAISMEELFSNRVEIEHIIPFSRSFDNSRNNKTVCFSESNRYKGNKTPFEAFANSSNGYNWDEIIARAKNMQRKLWRFLPDAMEKFQDSEEGQYIQRQLNDTKYMSRIARQYAEFVSGPNTVRAIKGKFTNDLRHHWGLEQFTHKNIDGKFIKNRDSHQHHAIDAIVVALTDNSAMQKLAKANKVAKEKGSQKLYLELAKPFQGFDTDKIKLKLQLMVISHKLDHKGVALAKAKGATIGTLHEDTNYGKVSDNIYALRKELTADNFKNKKSIETIASNKIRRDVAQIFEKTEGDKKQYEQALEEYKNNSSQNPYHKLKKVRTHQKKEGLIPIKDKNDKAYRYVKGGNNFCAEIWCTDKGKKAGIWQCEVIQNYYINQKGYVPNWRQTNPTAYKVMRLQINDMVALDEKGKRIICRIQKMSAKGQIVLRLHDDATAIQETQISKTASTIQNANLRKIFVSPIGKIFDPGKARQPRK